mmetsp:Transcript_41305/g.41927  ORF Transcript_41305/g.41927 Transcript_41305/m.41927 type:complete len:205 (-) Transcript_41305:115-729(-)
MAGGTADSGHHRVDGSRIHRRAGDRRRLPAHFLHRTSWTLRRNPGVLHRNSTARAGDCQPERRIRVRYSRGESGHSRTPHADQTPAAGGRDSDAQPAGAESAGEPTRGRVRSGNAVAGVHLLPIGGSDGRAPRGGGIARGRNVCVGKRVCQAWDASGGQRHALVVAHVRVGCSFDGSRGCVCAVGGVAVTAYASCGAGGGYCCG